MTLLKLFATYSLPTIVTSDINVHRERPDDVDSKMFLKIIDSFGVKQFVKSQSHELEELLDLIIISEDG